MKQRIVSFAIVFTFIFPFASLAQKPATKKDNKNVKARQLAVYQVKDWAAYIMQDFALKGVRAITLARFGEILCKDDPEYSKGLFEEALEYTTRELADPAQTKMQPFVRQTIIRTIARCDLQQAKDLLAQGEYDPDLYANIALEIAKDSPDAAMALFREAINKGSNSDLAWFLQELRVINPAGADQIFLQAVEQATGISQQDYLELGTYLFTSPRLSLTDPGMMGVSIAGVSVFDLTVDRPNRGQDLVRSYLKLGASILQRPVTDEQQRKYNFAIAYLLRPRAQLVTPKLDPIYAAALGGSTELVKETERRFKNAPPSFEDSMKAAEGIANTSERDFLYLNLAGRQWNQSNPDNKDNLKRARLAAGKISNLAVSAQVGKLIDFAEAAWDTKQGDFADAEKIAAELPPLMAAMTWLDIGRSSVGKGEPLRTRQAIDQGLRAAERVEGVEQAYLLLDGALQLAGTDMPAAQTSLVKAITVFNKEGGQAAVDWVQKVAITDQKFPVPFPLDNKVRLQYSLDSVLAPFVQADINGLFYRVKEIRDEQLRGRALIAAATALLKR